MATTISNGESGSSVRTKLNNIWEGLQINEIDSSIADTAVDVFVYDTSKDSDGGAWRKRTQGTSWYNETLNTATRGSRKEFPAVAVIVAEQEQITIYDGDDPDLPMWMVFNTGGTFWASNYMLGTGGSSFVSVKMLNGILTIANNGSVGLATVHFMLDIGDLVGANFAREYKGTIAERNDGNGHQDLADTSRHIASTTVNDVAMTVLPNAPIDAATGLPVPTIAVATNGGVSVIKDDGTVVDITESSNSTNLTANVEFLDNGKLVFRTDGNTDYKWVARLDLPSSDRTYAYLDEGDMPYVCYTAGADSSRLLLSPPYDGDAGTATTAFTSYRDNVAVGTIKGFGQGTTDPTQNDTVNTNLVNYTSSSYNTGWMNGDIKLATLSDTDDTDVTGSELVTNGTFDSDTDWTKGTGWSISGGVATCDDSQTDFSALTQAFSGLDSDKEYVITVDVTVTAGQFLLRFGATTSAGNLATINSSGSYVYTSKPLGATSGISFLAFASFAGTVDNISVRLAEEDRSVNGNGLQVFGTVTKNPVATGADLVAYSGFSSSNYLEQPYNSDLDFGTGDCCGMAWFKQEATALTRAIFDRDSATTDKAISFEIAATNSYLQISLDDGTDRVYVNSGVAVDNDVWHLGVWVRRGNTLELYLDGVLKNTGDVSSVDSISSTDARLRIGDYRRSALSMPFGGDIALVRLSATAPSPEQIARIYNDEKHLFTEGAQATLYGSSDAVTALAYDDSTEILSVGTSAGRSDFQGLRRVNNTTNAVGAAISASNGMIVEE